MSVSGCDRSLSRRHHQHTMRPRHDAMPAKCRCRCRCAQPVTRWMQASRPCIHNCTALCGSDSCGVGGQRNRHDGLCTEAALRAFHSAQQLRTGAPLGTIRAPALSECRCDVRCACLQRAWRGEGRRWSEAAAAGEGARRAASVYGGRGAAGRQGAGGPRPLTHGPSWLGSKV